MKVNNPILSGFYPDPSICAAGEDFYLVNSTFAYFPGVPIFHSRDLANWEQIGNVLDRESQLPLKGCGHSAGIFAPTIRYHDGMFYMITTNVSGGGNFIVTAKDPKGPWSEPYFLGRDAQGIDPSLFFDDDGKCYYVGNRNNSEGSKYFGDCEIWVQELCLASMKLTGTSHKIWDGAFKNAVWPEGPHLYKINGYYYLLAAEGGTGPAHAIMAARSSSIYGSYESNPNNPIISHRHLGRDYPVVYVGHGDLVEASDGNWYIVMLASRPQNGYTLMGRETFLAKVVWENGWPVINPSIGKLEDTVELTLKESRLLPKEPVYHFNDKKLPFEFVMLRNPEPDIYSLNERPGYLRLYMKPDTLKDKSSPSFIGVRQLHHDYQVNVMMEHGELLENESAGLAVIQNNEYHIRFEACQRDGKAVIDNNLYNISSEMPPAADITEEICTTNYQSMPKRYVRVITCIKGEDSLVSETEIGQVQGKGTIFMKLVNYGLYLSLYVKTDGEWILAAENIEVHFLSTETAGGFTGCVIGMYASSNSAPSSAYVDYHWFSYDEI